MKKEFIYLYLVDLCRIGLAEGHEYTDYEKEEPGYGKAMLNAYIKAFSLSGKPGVMNHRLLKTIHETAMSWNEAPGFKAGKYKSSYNNFTLYPMHMHLHERKVVNPGYNVTEQGIKEFIDYWLINNSASTHTIALCEKNPLNQKEILRAFGVISYNSSTDKFTCIEAGKEGQKHFEFTFEALMTKITEFQKTGVVEISIDILNEFPEDRLEEITSEILSKVFDDFNQNIRLCESEDEKIRVIMRHVQLIDQIHPFADGNVRTCYILMNKLFVDHGLGFCLPMNPNRFDMCSLDELCSMAKDGFLNFQQVMQHRTETTLVLENNELLSSSATLSCEPQSIETLLNRRLLKQFSELLSSPDQYRAEADSSISKQKMFKPEPFISPSINKAIKEANYSLALRRACFGAKASVIEMILQDYKNQINFEEQTSKGQSVFDLLKLNTKLEYGEKTGIHQLLESASNEHALLLKS